MSRSRRCTVRSARTGPSRGCSRRSTSPTSAPGSPRRRRAWTRSCSSACCPRPSRRFRRSTTSACARRAGAPSRRGCWARSPSWGCRCSSSPPTSARRWGSSGSPSPPWWATRWSWRWRTTSWRSSRRSAVGVEVECGVLGLPLAQRAAAGAQALASEPGEIVFAGEWYDYEAKYTPGGMELVVPARISDDRPRAGAGACCGDVRPGSAVKVWRAWTSSWMASRCSSTS